MADVNVVENPALVDWPELHAFVHRAYAYMEARIDPPSSLHRMTVGDFEQKSKDETLFVARCAEQLAGCMFCRSEGDYLYVGKVAVDPNLQGRGIGRALFERAFALARRNRFECLELETRVELIENHRTFEQLGFEKVGENAHEGYDQPTSIRMRALV